MQTHLTGGLALGQVHRMDLIKLLTPCPSLIKEEALLAIVMHKAFWPKGVANIAPAKGNAMRDATGGLSLSLDLQSPQSPRYPYHSAPVLLDLIYAPAILLGLVFGGSINRNGNKASSDYESRSYVRLTANPINTTLGSIVINAEDGKQTKTRGPNPHDSRRLSLKVERGLRSNAPRKAFIEKAGILYDNHAPLGFEISREQYLEALTGWFAKADKRYSEHEAAQECLKFQSGIDDRVIPHSSTATT